MELFDWYDVFGFQVSVDYYDVVVDFNNGIVDDGVWFQFGQVGLVGFKQFGK